MGQTMLKFLMLAALLAVAFAPTVRGAESEDDEAVFTLTTENFEEFMKNNEVVLVEFYAPWCGHCKALAPEYEKAAQKLKVSGGVPLAKVDATVETELGSKFEIKGYPTLKLFKNGEISMDYSGGRTADEIVEWLEKMTGPAVMVIAEDAAKALERGVHFVGRLKEGSDADKLFQKVAEKRRIEAKFSVVRSDKNEITALRPNEDPVVHKVDKEADLDKFLGEERFPLFGPIDGDTYAAYEARTQEIVWFAGKEDEFKSNGAAFRDTAKHFRNDYSFVWLDTERFGSHAENGLGITKLPGLVLRLREGGRYLYPEGKEFVAKDMTKFFEDVKAGKIEKFLKSEPIPETNDEPVKVVVGKNFDEIVFRKDKDVMLEIYAPWCGHCKKLEPFYNELAEKLLTVKHVVIAKMDGTANEPSSPDFNYRGFPTIFWVKAGETKPETFSGSRTVEGLLSFIKENSSKPVEVALESAADEDEEDKDEL